MKQKSRGLLNNCIKAIHDKDIEGVMSIYAPNVVSFDIVPPLQYIGADAFRKVWEEVFLVYQGPIVYEIHDLDITVGGDVAFTHSLNHISGTMTNGQKGDLWVRWTACFRKINGKWLIVHHHVSVPVPLEQRAEAIINQPAKVGLVASALRRANDFNQYHPLAQ
jgi:ketosteroid isomerase-like protein